MAGLEIAGLILGIVGVVPVLKDIVKCAREFREYRNWKKSKSAKDVLKLEEKSHSSATRIQSIYNDYVRSFGRAFERGDGKPCRETG